MKKESLHKLFALAAAAGLLGFAPVAQAAEEEEESPLGKAMDEIGGSLKSLRRLARDPERWAKSAEAVRGGVAACITALSLVPAEIEAMADGPDKVKAMADSRRLMGLTLAGLCELELAFLAEDEAKANEIIEKLQDIKGEAHEKYNKDE